MKFAIGVALACATVCLTGCSLFHHQAKPVTPPVATQPTATPPPKPVIKPDLRVTGDIAMVNHDGRFAVVTFAPGTVPPIGQHLSVYHNGLKVGDLKVTGPQRETDTVADIVAGEVSAHDEARAE